MDSLSTKPLEDSIYMCIGINIKGTISILQINQNNTNAWYYMGHILIMLVWFTWELCILFLFLKIYAYLIYQVKNYLWAVMGTFFGYFLACTHLGDKVQWPQNHVHNKKQIIIGTNK